MLANVVFSGYTVLYLVAALASAVAGSFAWKRRQAPGASWLCITSVSATVWALAGALDYSSLTLSAHVFWGKVSYLGSTTAPVFLLMFVLEYSGRSRWTRPVVVVALLVVPVLGIAAAFTNELHQLVWPGFALLAERPTLIVYYHGPAYWVLTSYGLTLGLLASVQLLVIAVRARTLYRAQSVAVMIAVLIPWCAELAKSLAPGAWPGIDSAVVLPFTSAILAFAMLRFRLLDVVPVPREVLVEEMTDGLLVLDHESRVLEINPAAIRLLGVDRPVRMGEPIAEVLGHWPEAAEAVLGGDCCETCDTRLSRNGIDLSVHRLRLRHDGQGRERDMYMLRNVTAQVRAEEALQQAVGDLQARVFEIEALQAELRDQAIRDPLTNLSNRRYFTESLEHELGRASRAGDPVSLVMFDVDHFKEINDALGHAAGDAVLLALGAELQTHTRVGDVACRYGGDEFLVALPNTPLEVAVQFAERWRTHWRDGKRHFGTCNAHGSLSLGVAAFPEHGTTPDELIHSADTAVYAAKAAGRDCVRVAETRLDEARMIAPLPISGNENTEPCGTQDAEESPTLAR